MILTLISCLLGPTPPDTSDPSRDEGDDGVAQIIIRRDAYGVPHVEAPTDEGALYGVGWAQAEDRLFQMTTAVLSQQGRMAEHFGAEHTDQDIKSRHMGLWRSAQAAAEQLDDETLALLQAYSDGVNAWTAVHSDDPSPLFASYGVEPQTWTPAHCIASWYALAGAFAGQGLGDAERLVEFEKDVREFGEREALEMWLDIHPGDPSAGVVQLDDLDPVYVQSVQDYARSLGFDGDGQDAFMQPGVDAPQFSHAYAVGGARTHSGESILISDPQLPLRLPAIWYEFAVQGDTLDARGISVPGTPGLAIGFTPEVAWGVTASGSDQGDLYVLDMLDDHTYQVDGQIYTLQEEREEILVKDGATVNITYQESIWGPVITELIDGADRSYALHTALWSEGRATETGMLKMMKADSLDSFVAALDDWRAPAVNLVAADAEGHTYYSLIGAVPLRSPSEPLAGLIALDGGKRDTAWLDIIPHRYMPQVTDRSGGAVYSGNHRPVGAWYPLPLVIPGNTGGHSHRSRRLRDLLDTQTVFDLDSMLSTVQYDCVDPTKLDVIALAEHVELVAPGMLSEDALRVLNLLETWDGSMETRGSLQYLAARVKTNFREGQTGAVLQDVYGGGSSGMNFFLDAMLARIAENPGYLPGDEEIAYLSTILEDAGKDLTPANTWHGLWKEERAILDLSLFGFIEGMDLAQQWQYTTQPIDCAYKSTIWSQPSQSYTHVVDFSGESLSLMPIGHSERRDSEWILSEASLWEEGGFKPAPLDDVGIEAITISEESLIYIQ